MTPEAALDLCRFLHDAAAMLLWGASAYLSTLVPKDLSLTVDRRLRGFSITALAVAVATTAAALPLEAAYIGDGWPDAFDLPTLGGVLFDTSAGTAWMVAAVCALLLLSAAIMTPTARRRMAIAVATGALLASLVLTGHARMPGGILGFAHRVNDALHVLAGGAWLGALVPLAFIMPGLRVPALRRVAETAVRRFSVAGHWAVAIVIATGIVNTFLILGHWPTDWASPYQALLMLKIGLVLGMVCLAILNRYVWLGTANNADTVRIVERAMLGEIALGLGAVALAAVFGMLAPA